MPSETNSSEIINLLNRTPEFTELAARHGPFFFGVFLVLVAVILILLNKNRYISSFFALCGVLFMVTASLIYSGFGSSIHAYTMRINNLAENDLLALTDSPPRLYRHNRIHDLDSDSYYIELVTISPTKLEKDHSFKIIIKEAQTLERSDGTQKISYIKYNVMIPFKGKAHSNYELERMGNANEEEESSGGYKLVEYLTNNTQSAALSFFQNSFVSEVNAGEVSHSLGGLPNMVAEESNDENIEVIYFKRSADHEKVTSALKNTGITYGIKQSRLSKPINAVWVGVDVPSSVVENIGNSLLKEGVDLQYIGYFKYRNTKTNVVQIGYSGKNSKQKLVSQENIELFVNGLKTQQEKALIQQKQEEQINILYQEKVQKQQFIQQK
jgi:hypothetical protein